MGGAGVLGEHSNPKGSQRRQGVAGQSAHRASTAGPAWSEVLSMALKEAFDEFPDPMNGPVGQVTYPQTEELRSRKRALLTQHPQNGFPVDSVPQRLPLRIRPLPFLALAMERTTRRRTPKSTLVFAPLGKIFAPSLTNRSTTPGVELPAPLPSL